MTKEEKAMKIVYNEITSESPRLSVILDTLSDESLDTDTLSDIIDEWELDVKQKYSEITNQAQELFDFLAEADKEFGD